jgi:hypothetical protein
MSAALLIPFQMSLRIYFLNDVKKVMFISFGERIAVVIISALLRVVYLFMIFKKIPKVTECSPLFANTQASSTVSTLKSN